LRKASNVGEAVILPGPGGSNTIGKTAMQPNVINKEIRLTKLVIFFNGQPVDSVRRLVTLARGHVHLEIMS